MAQAENLSKVGRILWFIGVFIVITTQFCFAHDPAGISAASGWTIVVTLVIAMAASFLSFRYFFPMVRERSLYLRIITGALAIIIPFVLVVCLIFPLVFAIIYTQIIG
jgi:riboflavin transporter FmnP